MSVPVCMFDDVVEGIFFLVLSSLLSPFLSLSLLSFLSTAWFFAISLSLFPPFFLLPNLSVHFFFKLSSLFSCSALSPSS